MSVPFSDISKPARRVTFNDEKANKRPSLTKSDPVPALSSASDTQSEDSVQTQPGPMSPTRSMHVPTPAILPELKSENIAWGGIPVPPNVWEHPPRRQEPLASRCRYAPDLETGFTKISTIEDEWQTSTGASCHVTNDKRWYVSGTYEPRVCRPIITGSGTVQPEGSGMVQLKVIASSGKTFTLRLRRVVFAPSYPTNIFALSSVYRLDVGGWLANKTIFIKGKVVGSVRVTRKGMFLNLAEMKLNSSQLVEQ